MSVVLLPGDAVDIASSSAIKLGPGLARNEGTLEQLVATTPGVFGHIDASSTAQSSLKSKMMDAGEPKRPQVAEWIETNTKRYVPALRDSVVVQITNRGPESYQCTLFTSSTPATLPSLSFEGATKRNKPNLKVGSLLYATVVSAGRHVEPELSCVAPESGKSQGFGELKKESEGVGMIFTVSCGLARSLLDPKHQLLQEVAAHFPFETAIGINGVIWVHAASSKQAITIGQVLHRADEKARHLAREGARATVAATNANDDALAIVRTRGLLDVAEIASIVDRMR